MYVDRAQHKKKLALDVSLILCGKLICLEVN